MLKFNMELGSCKSSAKDNIMNRWRGTFNKKLATLL